MRRGAASNSSAASEPALPQVYHAGEDPKHPEVCPYRHHPCLHDAPVHVRASHSCCFWTGPVAACCGLSLLPCHASTTAGPQGGKMSQHVDSLKGDAGCSCLACMGMCLPPA